MYAGAIRSTGLRRQKWEKQIRITIWKIRSSTDVDCSSRAGSAVHLHRLWATHFDSEPGDDPAHSDGYFPQHQHPSDRGGLAVHGNEPRRIGRPAHEHL